MRIAIVGCGAVGGRRARSLPRECSIAVCCDVDVGKAVALSQQYSGSEASSDWQATVKRPDVAAVVVATTHNMLAPVTAAAAAAGKHVLVEKPCARTKKDSFMSCYLKMRTIPPRRAKSGI